MNSSSPTMDEFYEERNREVLYIAPNCGLKLKLRNQSSASSKEFGLEYIVENIADFPLTSGVRESKGWLSPMRRVTLPSKEFEDAGIPPGSTWFAYVYPPKGLADQIDWKIVSRPVSRADSMGRSIVPVKSWALPYVATFGAYAYFNEKKDELLAVNAVTLQKTNYRLEIEGPFVATDKSYSQMQELNRYQSLYLDAYTEAGIIGSAWMDPGENRFIDTEAEGQSELECHHGGFLYFKRDKTAMIFLVLGIDRSIDTPAHGVGSMIFDANQICRKQLKSQSLSTTCPTGDQEAYVIHRLCEAGNKEKVSELLLANIFTNPLVQKKLLLNQDDFGWTPLHYACSNHAQDIGLIKVLIEACPEAVMITNNNNACPIHIACDNNPSLDVIKNLLEQGASKSTLKVQTKHHRFLPIHFACSNTITSFEVIKYLILQDPTTLHTKGKLGWTPLQRAIAGNQSNEIIEEVLSRSLSNAPPDGPKNQILFERSHGMLPIHFACLNGCSAKVISLLIEADSKDEAFYDIVESCKLYDLNNSTILHIALEHSPPDVVDLILLKEVNARCMNSENFKDLFEIAEKNKGMYPVHVACMRTDLGPDTMNTLMRLKRTSVHFRDSKGNTPLHFICHNKMVDERVVQILLDSEAEIMSAEGRDIYRMLEHHSILEKGQCQHINDFVHTPLSLAVDAGANGAHELFSPNLICLDELDREEKKRFLQLVLDNKKVREKIVNNLADRPYFFLIMLELIVNILASVIYISATARLVTDRTSINSLEIAVLSACLVIFISRELLQLRESAAFEYFADGWNSIELLSIVALFSAIFHLIELKLYEEIIPRKGLFILSGVLLLVQFMFIIRSTFLPFARFVAGLLSILIALGPFIVVSVLFLIMFTYSFLMSDERLEECPTFGKCFMFTLEGFFYGVDAFDVTPVTDVAFGVLAVVMLLNVVIAIVSNAWDDSMGETRGVFWKSRVEILFQYRFLKRFRNRNYFIFDMIDGMEFSHIFEQKTKDSAAKSKTKSSFASLMFSIKYMIVFLIGLVTLGIFWPTPLRRTILSTGMSKIDADDEDSEEDKKKLEKRLAELERVLDERLKK